MAHARTLQIYKEKTTYTYRYQPALQIYNSQFYFVKIKKKKKNTSFVLENKPTYFEKQVQVKLGDQLSLRVPNITWRKPHF